MNSKTIVFTDANRVELESRSIDPAKEPDSVWIETETSVLSAGTELACLSGSESWAPFPFVPGYGSVGRVIQAGSAEYGLKKGDRVFTYGRHEQFSQANTVIQKLPDSLPAEKAVFARMAAVAITALRVSECELGDRVAVMGLGLVGNFAAQLFSLAGCDVVGIDVSEQRREIAEICGIATTMAPGDSLKEQVSDWTAGKMCRTVVDATGVPSVAAKAPELAGKLGELILLGSPRCAYTTDLTPFLNYSHLAGFGNITIKGAHEYRFPLSEDAEQRYRHSFESNVRIILERILDDRIRTRELISHEVKPEDSASTYQGLREHGGDYMGVVFDWS